MPRPPLDTFRAALAAYDRAELGTLNTTAEALRAAATARGRAWNDRTPLRQWAANRLTAAEAAPLEHNGVTVGDR